MSLTVSIEIAATPTTSTTERGRLLERFARRLLETQNLSVTEEVRLTGMEVDLLATSLDTGERIFVECKGHRATLGAEAISKLLGNVELEGAQSGWLISTFALGKDAKGLREKWEQRPPADRRKLQIYDPPRLIRRLVAATVIVDPQSLVRPDNIRCSEEAYLLITPIGEFWAIPVIDVAGMRKAALLYEAKTGNRVVSVEVLDSISQTNTTLAELHWNLGGSARDTGDEHDAEFQSIVGVPVADHWADYRPARPADFVGREQLQRDTFDFFSSVANQETTTRILAVKAPSGWGKSSFVLKIASRASNQRNKGRTFVFAVDARAAISKRYGEFAIFRAFQEAFKCGFIDQPAEFAFGGVNNPFSTAPMSAVLAQLSAEKKVLCLIFDQFEELLYKAELESAFEEINKLCHAIDEAQANVVVAFSWKTDGTIPTEHKAYHLWHNLAERRYELELTPFDASETASALNRFARELGQPLAPQLRRLLRDHCQGYPWLLKKLCIHVIELTRSGMDQGDILSRSLSIQELFQKDLARLTQAEHACIRQVSQEAPAEFFRITDLFGDDVVNNLLSKRLVIRSGPRLNIYWDIFRDYVLTQRTPFIPISYVPQSALASYLAAEHLLLKSRKLTFDELAKALELAKGTAANIIRDMVMVGHAEANSRSEVAIALQGTEEAAAAAFIHFCKSHVVYQRLLHDIGSGVAFSPEMLGSVLSNALRPTPSRDLVEQYRQKLLRWFMTAGLVERQERQYVLRDVSKVRVLDDPEGRKYVRGGASLFLADAPPLKATEALESARTLRMGREELERLHGRNSVRALVSLNLLDGDCRPVAGGNTSLPSLDWVRNAAATSATITFVQQFIADAPQPMGTEIGAAVADHFGIDWSKGSMQRCGAALRNWALWLEGREQVGRGRRRRIRESRPISPTKKGPPKKRGRKSKLSDEQRRAALARLAGGEGLREIAASYGVDLSTISRLKNL